MRRLLILVDKIGERKGMFVDYLSKNIPNSEVKVAKFTDLVYEIDGKKVSVYVSSLGRNVKEFDLVYFRRAGGDYSISAATLAFCLKNLGIKFFDSTFENVGPLGSKLTSYIKLSLGGLPTIPSFFCFREYIDKYIDRIVEVLGYPFVAKELGTQRGKGVFLVKNKEDLQKLPRKTKRGNNTEFMFQKFIESDEEYRVLVLKETIGAFERKIRTDPNEFRSNVALGAREEFYDEAKIPDGIKKIAVEGARVLGIQIAGADVMIDRNDNMWLLEVNRGPGLTYDVKVSPELPNLAKFFDRELQ